jgi:hypothetical protein
MFRRNSSWGDGVFVPLWEIDWSFSGDAYQVSPNNWNLRSGNAQATIPGGATSNYPVWNYQVDPDNPPACAGLPTLVNVAVNPVPLVGGSNASVTVTLSQAAPVSGAVVYLSSGAEAFTPQATCLVLSGNTSATCAAAAGAVTVATQVTVTAMYYNSTQTATVTVVRQ